MKRKPRRRCGKETHRRRETGGRLCDSDDVKFQDAFDQLYLKLTAHRFIHEVVEVPCGVVEAARRQAAYVALIALQNAANGGFIALRRRVDHRKREQCFTVNAFQTRFICKKLLIVILHSFSEFSKGIRPSVLDCPPCHVQ